MGDGELSKHLRQRIRLARETVQAAGSFRVESGCLKENLRRLWIHSEFGPAYQDKVANQDFVIAWQAGAEPRGQNAFWAIVMSDGVTSSCWAECGAELACWTSLARLVELRRDASPKELALCSICAAGEAIGEMSDLIRKDPEEYRPGDEFEATWEYILSEGLLLQTTLTVVWWDGQLHIGIVGDGAVAVRGSSDATCRMIAGSDFQTSRVHALGPNNRQVAELDAQTSLDLATPCWLAIFTDGVGRGVSADISEIFARADMAREDGDTNPAQQVIAFLQQNRPAEFEDNLTLGLVHIDRLHS